MPEGPEVRMARDLLADVIDGQVLREVKPVSGKLLRQGVGDVSKLDLPQLVSRVDVKGKVISVWLENGAAICSTLGMSGWWYPHISQIDDELKQTGKAYYNAKTVAIGEVLATAFKHVRLQLVLDNDLSACYIDPRNFGNVTLYSPDEALEGHPFRRVGFDLLNELPKLTPSVLELRMMNLRKEATRTRRRMKLGDLCLNQDFIAGLGNIYRAETLYFCGLDPHARFEDISDDDFYGLVTVGSYVLASAYANKGDMHYPMSFLQTVHAEQPYVHRLEEAGEEWSHGHMVYARACDRNGHQVVADRSFGRTMWWCPTVQQAPV